MAGPLQVRGPHEGMLDVIETEHFALKWLSTQDTVPQRVAHLGEVLEAVWDEHVERMDWIQPFGTEAYKMNVYLGFPNTQGVPAIDFPGAYVSTDEDGFPFIVVLPEGIYDWPEDQLADIMAHEFHHTLQSTHPRFLDVEQGFFWWETTASWAVPYVWQDHDRANYAGALAQPHLSINSWELDLEGIGSPRNGKQYDTAAFAYFVSERHGTELIQRSWEEDHGFDDPLSFLDANLPDGLEPEFTDFAIAMATEDHPRAEAWSDEEIPGSNEITTRVDASGTNGWTTVHPSKLPEGWAWNRIDFELNGSAEVFVAFDNQRPRVLEAYLWTDLGGEEQVQPVGEGLFLKMEDGDRARLIVVAMPEDYRFERTYPYAYRFTVVQPITTVPYRANDGLTCSSVGGIGLVGSLDSWLRR